MILLKEYALKNKIPIINDDGLLFLLTLLKQEGITRMLEIGTAIGYTSISFAKERVEVQTIERNPKMIELAKQNFSSYNVEDKIILHEGDALDIDLKNEQFDIIFIDAAKAQYERFFKKFEKNLSKKGIIVCDNLNFHNLNPELVNRNTRQLLRKINDFKTFLISNPHFDTTFYDVGDGMSVSRRKL